MDIHNEIMAAATTGRRTIRVPASDWPAACLAAFAAELIDGAADGCPDADDAGMYPLVYRCAAGDWRGEMVRAECAPEHDLLAALAELVREADANCGEVTVAAVDAARAAIARATGQENV